MLWYIDSPSLRVYYLGEGGGSGWGDLVEEVVRRGGGDGGGSGREMGWSAVSEWLEGVVQWKWEEWRC